jgi:hypothetical protein
MPKKITSIVQTDSGILAIDETGQVWHLRLLYSTPPEGVRAVVIGGAWSPVGQPTG